MIRTLTSIHDAVFSRVEHASIPVMTTLARFLFAAVLLFYYWNSALTKLGDGFLGFLFPSDGAYIQIFPKAVEAAEKEPKAAAQSILDANPKGGKIETLTQGFELTIPLYRTAETKNKRPFQVTDQNMTDTVNLMVEYGGLDAKAKENPKAFYTNDYLPKGGS